MWIYQKPLRQKKVSVLITKRKKKVGGGRKRKKPAQWEPVLYLRPHLQPAISHCVALPVRMRIITTAKMSGFSASTPGAFRAMCFRENSPMGLPISSSNVALHALATLEVPVTNIHTRGKWRKTTDGMCQQAGRLWYPCRITEGAVDSAAAARPQKVQTQERVS